MKKILVIEDSEAISKGLKFLLEKEQFEVTICKNVEETIEILGKKEFDLSLIDITLPDGDGFEVCEYMKKYTSTPIIFLTAKDEETSVVKGLNMGAEDYIIKPFRNMELLSRINNVLKRFDTTSKTINCGDLIIDMDKQAAFVLGKDVELTALEYKIVLLLVKNKGKIVTRKQILNQIWDVAGNFVNDNTLTVYIKRIREKLGIADTIKTIKGTGYMI